MSSQADNLTNRFSRVTARIASACQAVGRDPAEVKLLAVSKTRPAADIEAALRLGQVHFGENYLQEALSKVELVTGPTWHFIGAIQSNKTRQIADHFDWVHTLEKAKTARRLSSQRDPAREPLQCLLQVNIDDEPTKAGVTPDTLPDLLSQLLDLPNLELRGLMTIPAPGPSTAVAFQQLANLRQELAQQFSLPRFDQLSMGMSADLEAAIEAGATWVRIGTALFGPRADKNQQQETA